MTTGNPLFSYIKESTLSPCTCQETKLKTNQTKQTNKTGEPERCRKVWKPLMLWCCCVTLNTSSSQRIPKCPFLERFLHAMSSHTQPVSISKQETAKLAFTSNLQTLRFMNGLHWSQFSLGFAILLHDRSLSAQLQVIIDACQGWGLNRFLVITEG